MLVWTYSRERFAVCNTETGVCKSRQWVVRSFETLPRPHIALTYTSRPMNMDYSDMIGDRVTLRIFGDNTLELYQGDKRVSHLSFDSF